MSYQRERDEFIVKAASEGLTLDQTTKLLRYASTLQRLAVAQCNGDYPYNGDRDRPSAYSLPCPYCDAHGKLEMCGDECPQCKGSGKTWHRDSEQDARHDKRYTACPKCEASGVHKPALKKGVCPDCRTSQLVVDLLSGHPARAVFGGDPRGAVLRLSTPRFPYDESGRNGANGLYVPARER